MEKCQLARCSRWLRRHLNAPLRFTETLEGEQLERWKIVDEMLYWTIRHALECKDCFRFLAKDGGWDRKTMEKMVRSFRITKKAVA
jgi:hypothetical protein